MVMLTKIITCFIEGFFFFFWLDGFRCCVVSFSMERDMWLRIESSRQEAVIYFVVCSTSYYLIFILYFGHRESNSGPCVYQAIAYAAELYHSLS